MYLNVKNDMKQLREQFNLLQDELAETNVQNGKYRGLILENENKLIALDTEILDL